MIVGDSRRPVRVSLVGIGKMGISHLAIARALGGVDVVGVCDAADYLRELLGKYTGLRMFSDVRRMLEESAPDAVIIATPTGSHAALVRQALERGIHVFCEKPLTLTSAESAELAELAERRDLVAQVGYHNRFVATFREAKRLLDAGAIGRISHALAEAYGPVVLRAKGSTWRSKRSTGGGCLYDYAAHPIDLATWFLGAPERVRGSVLTSVFSADTDDEVASTLVHTGGAVTQVSVSWSDESFRKMSTMMTINGSAGRIYVDRQELRVYLREPAAALPEYRVGWNIRYITELTPPTPFYLRGEEYTAQLEAFIAAVRAGDGRARENSFASAAATDAVLSAIMVDAVDVGGGGVVIGEPEPVAAPAVGGRGRRWWAR